MDASDGSVAVSGHIRTWVQHDAVIDAAWTSIGVNNISNDLVVTG